MSEKKFKLLFIVYTHSLGGGAEKILTTIVNNLNPDKYDIDILEYAHFDVKNEPVNSNIKYLKPIVSMSGDNKLKRVWKNIQVFSYAGFLKKRKEKYDLEISFNYLIPTFLLSGNVPSVAWNHGDIYVLNSKPYYKWLQRKSLKRVKKIVAISENTKESIISVYPEFENKTELIYNGFDTDAIRNAGNEKSNFEIKSPAIGYVGRLEDGKDPLRLLEVLNILKSRGKTVNLYYCGQGELKDSIIEKARELGVNDQIHLLGYINNPYPVMKQLNAICMMSKSEGFPTVFAEAMALDVPFISTPVGGVKEMSNCGKCGIIINSAEECANAIEENILDTDKLAKMKSACREHIANYDLKTQIKKIEALFDELLSN